MNKMRDELRKLADEQLVLEEGRCSSGAERNKKRAREADDTDSKPSGARRPRLDRVDAMITSHSPFQHLNGIDPAQAPPLIEQDVPAILPYLPSATALTPAANATESVAIDNFANMSDGLYSNSIAGLNPAVDNFDVYVHQPLNFPESWRTGHLNSGDATYR